MASPTGYGINNREQIKLEQNKRYNIGNIVQIDIFTYPL